MLPILKHSFTRRIFNTLAFELCALNICFALLIFSRKVAWVWSGDSQHALAPTLNSYAVAGFALSSTLVVQFSLWSFGLYSREVVYSGRRVFSSLLGAFLFSSILLLPVCYLFSAFSNVGLLQFTAKFYLFGLMGFASVIGLERFLVLRLFDDSPYLGNVLILGTGPATDQLVMEARKSHGKTFRLVGVLSENPDEEGQAVDGCRVIGTIDRIAEVVESRRVRAILISLPLHSPQLPTDFLLKCKLNGVLVMDSSDFYETLGKKMLLEKLDPIQLLLSEHLFMTRFRWAMKACCEKLAAVAALLVFSPVLCLAALLIRLTSPGPVLYRQARVGRDGKVFDLYKFRSMVADAEQNGEAVWAKENDPRVTPAGRVLRKFRIDEIPQLFNVLRGDMGIVGPRPERPEFVRQLAEAIPYYNERHLVPPGITGWAQVAFPYGSSIEDAREKLRYDLYYIKNMSLFFDVMIALFTVQTVLFGKGSR